MAFTPSCKALLGLAAGLSIAATLGGCQGQDPNRWVQNMGDYLNLRNGLLNPSEVGRFDKANPWGTSKPVTWPILEQLDMVDEPDLHWATATDPLPSDLVVEQKEYVVGEGDILDLGVYELVTPGILYQRQTQVNELGDISLQQIGSVHVSGLTPTQIEDKIGQIAVEKGFLLAKGNGTPGPQVSVQVTQSRTKIFSVLGQVGGPATYQIFTGADFRLLDALAMAHDITGGEQPGMDNLYVIRPQKGAGIIPAQTQPADSTGDMPTKNPLDTLDKLNTPTAPTSAPATAPAATSPSAEGPVFVHELPKSIATLSDNPKMLAQANLDSALGVSPTSAPATMPAMAPAVAPAETPAVPATMPATSNNEMLNSALGGATSKPGMIYVDGKWVEVNPGTSSAMSPAEAQAAATGITPPRVIRIPIEKLKEGDPRYNIIIQPGDVINVPNIPPGEFYMLGHVNRPGVYSLTGRKVTLKQAIAASGGLDPVAIPRRCDLIRRVGNTEVTVQIDLQRIFDGEQPDIFLKANDLINVGTDLVAPFLAVTRNAYRASYGWGFTYDRNFYNQPVITQSSGGTGSGGGVVTR